MAWFALRLVLYVAVDESEIWGLERRCHVEMEDPKAQRWLLIYLVWWQCRVVMQDAGVRM